MTPPARPFFAGTTAVVVGLARSGEAAVRLLARYGCRVRVTDARPRGALADQAARAEQAGASLALGGHPLTLLDGAGLVVVSPGVPLDVPLLETARERRIPVVGEIEIAAAVCPAPVVAVTGTNGKTTTTELIGHLFRTAGRPTVVAGNVGRAFAAEVEKAVPEGVVVLEVSSFQLATTERFHPHVAALLNLSPDHLDWHHTFEAYREAKARIFARQTRDDYAVLNAEDPAVRALAPRVTATLLAFGEAEPDGDGAFARHGSLWYRYAGTECAVLPAANLLIRGPHNLENALAALAAVVPFELPREDLGKGLASFRPLPHRLEEVAEIRGVRFVNDSKATNVDALEKALLSFDRPIVLIAGGRPKGDDFGRLAALAERGVSTAFLIGEAAPRIRDAWPDVATVECESLEEAIRTAFATAETGQAVVLAPGCASFDMFRDYEDRGERFRLEVARLSAEIAAGRPA